MRYKNNRNDNSDLYGLVSRQAQSTIVVDLAVGVSVRYLQDAGEQDQGDAHNSQNRNPGEWYPTPCHHEAHCTEL